MSIMSAEEAIKALTKIRLAEAKGTAGNAIDALAAISRAEVAGAASTSATAPADVPWDEPAAPQDTYEMMGGPDNVTPVVNRARQERSAELEELRHAGYTEQTYTANQHGRVLAGEAEATRRPSETAGPPATYRADEVQRAKRRDARGADLTWAGGDAPDPTVAPLHARVLEPDYAGESTGAAQFPAGSMRGGLAADDRGWTTEYDPRNTASVRATSVAQPPGDTDSPRGRPLLRGPDGSLLSGTFGYVVDPRTGTLHTFNPAEAYVTKNGTRVDITSDPQKIAVLEQAVKDGEPISFVHHSTALAGGDVAGAGKLTVAAGQITKIDDDSGHYKAEAEYLWQTVTWLAAQGMPVADIDVKLIAKGDKPELILQGWQFAQTGGNEGQIRAKQVVTGELARPEAERQRQRLDAERAERERLRQERLSRVASEHARLKADHANKASCTNLNVMDDGVGGVYCGSCDGNLDASYKVLRGTGSF